MPEVEHTGFRKTDECKKMFEDQQWCCGICKNAPNGEGDVNVQTTTVWFVDHETPEGLR